MSFLAPHDRTPLLDALRPPQGYSLHTAIGTTFSLDLVALLTAPVGFTFFELEQGDSSLGDHAPLELLEAIRRHAGQMLIFCEAGRIVVPPKHRALFSFLEDRIVQARAPKEGRAFHPKLWLIRYVAEDGAVAYRLLCMSRNLTFDRSLDTLLVLDGVLRGDRTVGFSVNRPLTEFAKALPGMAVRELSKSQEEQCTLVASEVGRVEWKLEGLPVEDIAFWPLGHVGRKGWPFRSTGTRMLVASPFVTPSVLDDLTVDGDGHILIGRQQELDKLDEETLAYFSDCYVVRSQLETEESATQGEDVVAAHDLHAKLYIADRGWDASVWTGSANATRAAFDGNVEFLVELVGKKSKLGIDAFLAKHSGTVSIPDLLEQYQRPVDIAVDADAEALEAAIEAVRRDLAVLPWYVSVAAARTAEEFSVTVGADGDMPPMPSNVRSTVRLLSLAGESAVPLPANGELKVAFESVGLEGLTAFLVVQITAALHGKSQSAQFIVNATLLGEPPNRRDRLVRTMLSDRKAVVRYLLLLLAEVNEDAEAVLGASAARTGRAAAYNADESEALLEPLLRTFQRDPSRLVPVAALVRDLAGAPETADLVPEGLLQLVEVLDAARGEVVR